MNPILHPPRYSHTFLQDHTRSLQELLLGREKRMNLSVYMWMCVYVFNNIKITPQIYMSSVKLFLFLSLSLSFILAITRLSLAERLHHPWHSMGQQGDTPLLWWWCRTSGCGLHSQAEAVQETGRDLFSWEIINSSIGQLVLIILAEYLLLIHTASSKIINRGGGTLISPSIQFL